MEGQTSMRATRLVVTAAHETRDYREVGVLQASWVGIDICSGISNGGRSDLMERRGIDEGRLKGDERRVGHRNSHFLDENQQRKHCSSRPIYVL
ncbi:hypothetical protein EVAR_62194_1 [Eumeta japonica]|uniref:Uncharacterized protein n=1 Tax=Eumeta variegata TaxID=151549 RepID=A0A4C1Z086_EUMVA|nr:hypothetical protein EVAR_62194_1 [Eumeta japonica]